MGVYNVFPNTFLNAIPAPEEMLLRLVASSTLLAGVNTGPWPLSAGISASRARLRPYNTALSVLTDTKKPPCRLLFQVPQVRRVPEKKQHKQPNMF